MDPFDASDVPDSHVLCGLDEAGRGPLAGPVFAACVVLPRNFPIDLLDDSKKLSLARREAARAAILSHSLAYGIASASPHEIDSINILEASMLAMKRAFLAMKAGFPGVDVRLAVVDGTKVPSLPVEGRAVVRGDSLFPCIMAASILAKTSRDLYMEIWDAICPEYGYAKHKGYPTRAHSLACSRLGPSSIQRLTFNYPGKPGYEGKKERR